MWTPGPWPDAMKESPGMRKRKAAWHRELRNECISEAPTKRAAIVSPKESNRLCQTIARNAIQIYTVLGETNATVRKCLQSTDATFYCDGYVNQAHSWKQHQLSTLVPSTVRTGHTRTQYDKAFCCEWINNRHVAVSTKCGHVLKVDRQTRSYQEVMLEGSRWVEPRIVTDEDLHMYRVNRGGIHCVRSNAAKTMLACSGGHGEDNNVFVLDLQNEKWSAIHKGVGHQDWVFTLSWLSDSVFASGSRDHTIKLWSPAASQQYIMQPTVEYSNHEAKVRCCAFDHNTERFVSMDVSGKIFLWDPVGTGGEMSVVRKLQLDPEYREECTCMLLDQNMLVAGAREHVTIYDPRRPAPILSTPLGKISYDDVINAVAARSLSKQGPLLGIGLSTGGNVMFCDVRKFSSNISDTSKGLQAAVAPVIEAPSAPSKAQAALDACCLTQPILPGLVSSQAKQDLVLSRAFQTATTLLQDGKYALSLRSLLRHKLPVGWCKPGQNQGSDGSTRRYNLRQRRQIQLPARCVGTGVDPDPVIARAAASDVSLPYSCSTLDLSSSVAPCGVIEQPEGDLHFDDVVQSSLGVDNAVFSHNWSPDGRTMFACGGPLAIGMRGCCLSLWD